MSAIRASEWRKLPLNLTELCIDTTLRCGQSFRWRKIDDEWHCALYGRIISLKQDPDFLHYRVTWPKGGTAPPTPPASASSSGSGSGGRTPDQAAAGGDGDDTEALLRNYFNLDHDLAGLYQQWAAADANFRRRAPRFAGVRVLNQDAWEALVCFICSSNNNIARISQMVHRMCLRYGAPLGTVRGEAFHDFPRPDALASGGPAVEAALRDLGFGYRAKYIFETARIVARHKPRGWLLGLRNPRSAAWGSPPPPPAPVVKTEEDTSPGDAQAQAEAEAQAPTYRRAFEELVQLCGVGPKVADCVCLMGLGWGEAVPVDTHVWQIAVRDYRFGVGGRSGTKSLSRATYDAVGDHFRGLWGEQAGWAHSVLFAADLPVFSDRLAEKKVEGGEGREGQEVSSGGVKVEAEEVAVVAPAGTPPGKRKVVVSQVKVEEDDEPAVVAVVSSSEPRKRRKTGR